jgi:hypothetical protein
MAHVFGLTCSALFKVAPLQHGPECKQHRSNSKLKIHITIFNNFGDRPLLPKIKVLIENRKIAANLQSSFTTNFRLVLKYSKAFGQQDFTWMRNLKIMEMVTLTLQHSRAIFNATERRRGRERQKPWKQ